MSAHIFKTASTKSDFQTMMESAGDKAVFVKFSATWCPPCVRMKEFLEDYCKGKEDNAVYIAIDVDENGEVAAEYNVSSIPVLLVFVNGQQKEKVVGFDKTKV